MSSEGDGPQERAEEEEVGLPCVRISPRRRSSHADRGGRRCGGIFAAAVSVPHANGPYKFGKVLHIQLLLGTSKGSALKGGRGRRGAFGMDETNAPLWLSGIGDKTHSRFSALEEGLLEKGRERALHFFAVHHQLVGWKGTNDWAHSYYS